MKITRIYGRSERYGRRLLERIKKHLKKERHQFVTIDKISNYTGIKN